MLLASMIVGCLLPTAALYAATPFKEATTDTANPISAMPLLIGPTAPEDEVVVAQIGFRSFAELQALTQRVDVWEVKHTDRAGHGSVVALLPTALLIQLRGEGYWVEVDPLRSALLHWRPTVAAQQQAGIPGFPCYRTVTETYTSLQTLATQHPTLAQWVDIGDSWDKSTPGGPDGYDLQAIILTNQATPGPKPVLFIMAAMHAREFVTAEVATRFAEMLVNQYGTDADVRWLLDTTEIHIVAQANPDGRERAEEVVLWRKNTNSNSCPNETPFFSYYGVDLNRNSSFKWNQCEGFSCSSNQGCVDTFRGESPASEPETQAFEAYMRSIFADQRGPNDDDAAPSDTSGIAISLHSYSELILFPWGWRAAPTPNHAELETLGRKMGYFTDYQVCQAGEPGCIYQTDGTIDDWAYGELGVAAYTFELGTEFFQQCTYFESEIIDDALDALFYAAKSAGRPYQLPSGPETLSVTTAITGVVTLTESLPISDITPTLLVTAVADDTRYASNGWGIEPTQTISATRLTISPAELGTHAITDVLTTTNVYTMDAADGLFDSSVETVTLRLQLSPQPAEQYLLRLESQDSAGNWGATTAAYAYLTAPTAILPEAEPSPAQTIYLPLITR